MQRLPFAYQTAGLHTEIYDAFTGPDDSGVSGDVDFYLALARRRQGPVLELACGTGRVSIALAEAGFEVVGVDLSRAMLRIARERRDDLDAGAASRLSFAQANMATVDLGRRFATVLIPYRSFHLLPTLQDQRRCLEVVRRHLAPAGVAAIDLFDPDLSLLAIEAWGGLELDWEGDHPVTGNLVRVEVVERRNDRVNQVLRQRLRFTEFAPDGSERRREEEVLQLRWLYRWEMHLLLEVCGLEIEAEYSDYAGSPPTYGGEQVYVVRAAG